MRRVALPLLCVVLLLPAAGCLRRQPAPRVVSYVLRPERAAPAPEPPGADTLRVEPVRVAPLFERNGFVYRTGERSFESDYYQRFAAPPGVLVREALADWLETAGLFSGVQRSGDRARARWWLEVRVTALYADLRDASGAKAVVEIKLELVDTRTSALETRLREHYRAEVPASTDPAALAEAWTHGLAQILSSLEADLRAVLAEEAGT